MVLLAPRFSECRFSDRIAEHRPTVIIDVPTVVNMLLGRPPPNHRPAFKGVRFRSRRTAPLMVEQPRRFEETYGIQLVQIYGMSEAGYGCPRPHEAVEPMRART